MQLNELLPLISLMRAQRILLYRVPGGACIGSYRREDISGKMPDELLRAEITGVDANSNNINLYISTEV